MKNEYDLRALTLNGNWEQWINFFLEGIYETAKDAKNILNDIQKLFNKDLEKN